MRIDIAEDSGTFAGSKRANRSDGTGEQLLSQSVVGGSLYLEHYLTIVLVLHARNSGDNNRTAAVSKLMRKQFLERTSRRVQPCLVVMTQMDDNYPMERGIMEELSFAYLLSEEGVVVVRYEVLEERMLGVGGLDDHLPDIAFASCPSCYLLEHLKSAFGRAKIGLVKEGIGLEYADQTDIIEMESLGDHLRTDEDIYLMRSKLLDDALMPVFGAGSV